MKAYKIEKDSYKIKLNANENPYEIIFKNTLSLNRYPNEANDELRDLLSETLNIENNQIILGNGSSEMIELVLKTYLEPNESVMSFEPSFVMYKKFTEIYKGKYVGVKTKDYVMDMDALKEAVEIENPKVVFICNPNNPTGAKVSKMNLENFLNFYKGLVVIDEAYMDFTEGSMINRLESHKNLIILKTFSKAYGLAGARLGYLLAQPKLIDELLAYKSPYNVSQLSLEMGLQILKDGWSTQKNIQNIKKNRQVLYKGLCNLPLKVYPSFGNFIAFKGPQGLMSYLKSKAIIIRNFEDNLYRVSVGKEEENDEFLNQMNAYFKEVTYD